jgi:quinol monooxygenase YgiN
MVSNQIEFVVEWTIKPGKYEEFKKLAGDATKKVDETEPDARRYIWYFSEDKNRCILTECYVDSEAILFHLKNVGPILKEMFKSSSITRFEVLGNLSKDAEEAVRARGAKIFTYGNGVNR